MSPHSRETTGKGPGDESFPVASLLLAPAVRRAVLAFYRFVREADDIADAEDLRAEEKLARLDALEAALLASDPSHSNAAALSAVDRHYGAGIIEAQALLAAFRQDATCTRYRSWEELLAYCRRSADPVGRFLLRLHGEDETTFAPADALCTALQLLNHLQDLGPDRERLDRIYLPLPWLDRAGGEAGFFEPANAASRRPILDAALDRVDALIDRARLLPNLVRDRRLAWQCRTTIAFADALARRLRRADPILARVNVGKADAARAILAGVSGALPVGEAGDRAVTRAAVARSGSSFRLGMSTLPGERRRAIHAVYAFCRQIDDIADGAAPVSEKRRFLEEWRREIEALDLAPTTPVGRELAWASARYDLPRDEFHALLDGMETDCAERVRIVDDADLALYARRVAGAVGVLSVRIFGAPDAHDFAVGLGHTLQLVNILRDLDEDAALERVYVPLSRLDIANLVDRPASDLIALPRFPAACSALALEAEAGFAAADRALAVLDRRALRPAILMMEGYRRILAGLRERGFDRRGGRLRLGRRDRLGLLALALSQHFSRGTTPPAASEARP